MSQATVIGIGLLAVSVLLLVIGWGAVGSLFMLASAGAALYGAVTDSR